MSEFDKEAERERLRKKFAEDEAERASARNMSELLLKGATMTDRHCPECGTPLFRQDGRTFCPECERTVVTAAEGEASTTDEDAKETAEPAEATTAPTASGDTRTDLERALERAASAAARADDPRTAREHLEAARAAIEALNALDERG